MDAPDQLHELRRRSDELRARSERARAASAKGRAGAAERVELSRQLIAAPPRPRRLSCTPTAGSRPGPRWPCRPPWAAANVIIVGSDPGDSTGGSTRLDLERLRSVRLEAQALRQTSQQAIARARATRYLTRRGRPQRQVLRDSAYARLLARQETMAVIEQAKGIIMAEQRCGPYEAFDLLRRVSQQANVKLREVAAQIVEHVASSGNHCNGTPIAVGVAQACWGNAEGMERAEAGFRR